MTAVVLRADLSEQTIDLAEHEALVEHQAAGAVVGFAGVVRDHDGGRSVTRLEYSAHPSARQTLAEVAAEIAGRVARRAGDRRQPSHRHARHR